MALSLIQSASATADGNAVSIAAAFPNNVTAGNLLVAALAFGNSFSVDPVVTGSDKLGNVYTEAVRPHPWDTGNVQGSSILFTSNSLGGANSITASFGLLADFRRMWIFEWSGVASSNAFDKGSGSFNSVGSTAVDGVKSPFILTTADGDLVIGVSEDSIGTGAHQTGSGFSNFKIVVTEFMVESQTQAVAGLISASFSYGSSHANTTSVVTFKAIPSVVSSPVNTSNFFHFF